MNEIEQGRCFGKERDLGTDFGERVWNNLKKHINENTQWSKFREINETEQKKWILKEEN